jgi:hypothetical protein
VAVVNITCENDSDFYRQFVYQTIDGVPINLTGNTMRMGIRHRAADAKEELLLTTENGSLTIVDPANGKFTVWISKAQLLEDLPLGNYEHSLIRMVGGMHFRIWSGALINRAGASR